MPRERMVEFERFVLFMTLGQARGASHQGDCGEDAQALAREAAIAKQFDAIGPEDLRAELKECGAWDDDALADDDMNRVRIVWLAAGDIVERMREAQGRRFFQCRDRGWPVRECYR